MVKRIYSRIFRGIQNRNIIYAAIRTGNIEMMDFLYDKGFLITNGSFERACEMSNLATIKWLHQKKCRFEPRFYCVCKSEEILEWFYQNEYPLPHHINREATFVAIKWLYKKGLELSPVLYGSERPNDYKMLNWLYENKCPSSDDLFYDAVCADNKGLIRWLMLKEYPFDDYVLVAALEIEHKELVNWLLERKCKILGQAYYMAIQHNQYEHIELFRKFADWNSLDEYDSFIDSNGIDGVIEHCGEWHDRYYTYFIDEERFDLVKKYYPFHKYADLCSIGEAQDMDILAFGLNEGLEWNGEITKSMLEKISGNISRGQKLAECALIIKNVKAVVY